MKETKKTPTLMTTGEAARQLWKVKSTDPKMVKYALRDLALAAVVEEEQKRKRVKPQT